MHDRKLTAVGIAAFLVFSTLGSAIADDVAILSYNIRGLPPFPPFVEDRTAEIAEIATRLEDYHTAGGNIDGIDSVVLLQELFHQAYYDTITSGATVSYPFITAKDAGGSLNIGDGLNMLADYSSTGFTRVQWDSCFGSGLDGGADCDTNKGFSVARFEIGTGLFVDVYNLHADAGQDEDSRTARRDNIDQLIAYINTNSPAGQAVIIAGDTNSRYTRSPNDNIETLLSGTGVTDVWVEMVNGGVVPGSGPNIESGCDSNPSGADCELIDKVFYRSGTGVILTPVSYAALQAEFADGGGDLSDHIPVEVLFSVTAGGSTTTTTTVSSTTTTTLSTTTTTLAGGGECADPVPPFTAGVGTGSAVTASDALFILGAAVGTQVCELCVCDTDGNGNIAASDALRTLNAAVGVQIPLLCPACT
jgi:hypothetical protein